jgi:HlyD family secretion protein
MKHRMYSCPPLPPTLRRTGGAATILVIALVVLTVVLIGGIFAWSKFGATIEADPSLAIEAIRSNFIHEITTDGEIESASNIDVRCQVESRGGSVTILTVIDEGTLVEEGDILCELDSASLKEERAQQEIICNGSRASVTQAEADLATALLSLEEYTKGTFVQEQKRYQNQIAEAEETQKRQEEILSHSLELFEKGYVTQMQIDANEWAVERAVRDREIAQIELDNLEKYTKEKMLEQLSSSIETAEARLDSEQNSYRLDEEQLTLIETQIVNCTIRAPAAGQVVYRNETDHRGGSEFIVQEGATVRERQILFMLPDYSQMQVKCKLNETHVSLVRPGMTATIELDALPGVVLTGYVDNVSEYPLPTSWFSANIKQYESIVRIDDAIEGLRPGLTAKIAILVDEKEDVLNVPVQCVFEHGGDLYSILYNDDQRKWKPVKVQVGGTNDMQIIILDGLKEGDHVVHGGTRFRDDFFDTEDESDPEADEGASPPGEADEGPPSGGGPPAAGGPGGAPSGGQPSGGGASAAGQRPSGTGGGAGAAGGGGR